VLLQLYILSLAPVGRAALLHMQTLRVSATSPDRDFWILRAFLGIFEAGIYQGSFYVLSRWFLPSELQKRQGIWYTATMVSGALGGLIAYGVGGLQGRLGYQQWQWLFLIEGTLSKRAFLPFAATTNDLTDFLIYSYLCRRRGILPLPRSSWEMEVSFLHRR
jgi:MFS family permease